MTHITAAQFTARFTTLVLKGNGMPSKKEDRHILLVSALLGLETGREYSEKELNETLRVWATNFGDNVGLDHVTLRRSLVDERYLNRDAAGKVYVATREALPFTLDSAIWSLDLKGLVNDAQKDREERKRLHRHEDSQ